MESIGSNREEGAERRRYVRVPVGLDARISLGGRPPLACTIRDVCDAGMFIAVATRDLIDAVVQEPATLDFALFVDGQRRGFELPLLVCRVATGGLGVAFDRADPETVRLLREFAGPSAANEGSLAAAQRDFAPEFAGLLPQISALVEKNADQLAVEFTRQLDESLFVAARDAQSNRDMIFYSDLQTQLRRREEALRRQVPATLLEAVALLDNPLAERAAPTEVTAATTLSLVDKEEFEEFLSFSEAVSELETRLREPLRALTRRLGHLARRPMSEAGNPVGPAVVCGVFAESLKGLLANRGVCDLAYRRLRRLAEVHLARLYEELNALLVEQGILPVIEQEKVAIKPLGAERRAEPAAPSGGQDGVPPGLTATSPPQGSSAFLQSGGGVPPVSSTFAGFPLSADPTASALAPLFPGGGFAGDVALASFGHGPAVSVLPTLQQAYQMAQTQLALRRQLAPDLAATPVPARQQYSLEQVAHGLDGLQRQLLDEAEPTLLSAEDIKRRLAQTLATQGFGERAIDQGASDAIEVIVSLFEALLRDSLVPDFAKTQLKRLQPSVHRAALVEEDFFASTQHPLRQVMNRLSLLRHEQGAEWQQLTEQVRDLVDGVSRGYDGSPEAVRPAVSALDEILRDQQRRYASSVEQVVAGCNEQQAVLRERREKSGMRPGEATAQQQLPDEWNRWLKRARNLRVGERLLMSASGCEAVPVTLAWVGEDFNPYVFVDPRGAKASTLTLQQVAMYLRRGLLKVLPDDGAAAVDRALFGVVNRYHEQVAEQAHQDTLTGLLNRKAFLQSLEERLPPADTAAEAGGALCMLALDNLKSINERHGLRAGDAVLRRVAETLRNRYGRKPVALGRLGGGEIGLYWEHSPLQSAYRDVQELCATLNLIESVQDGDALPLRCCAGVLAVEGDAVKPADLVNAVGEACLTARSQADRPVHIAGGDQAQRRQIAQLSAYIEKAHARGRLALLCQEVRPLSGQGSPAAYVVVSAEDRNGKLVPPTLFAQAVAACACAGDIDLWALRQTLGWMARNEESVEHFSAFILPLSRAALASDTLAATITAELMQIAVPPSKICFEIPDRDAVTKLAEMADLVNTLREFGCQFILGNFGAARTNYEYLKELAVDYVSIQQEFIDEARQNQKDFAMAKSMNELIHFMGKATIARQAGDAVGIDFARTLGLDFIHDQTRATRLVL